MQWKGAEYLGWKCWVDGKPAYRIKCEDRELGVVFSADAAWKLVVGDRVVDLDSVPPVSRSAPKMFKGVSID